MYEFFQELRAILIILALILGGIQCFFGHKLFRVMTAIIGFLVGGIIGIAIGAIIAEEIGAVICFLVLGALGAVLSYTLYKLGVFIVCFGSGAMIGLLLAMAMGNEDAFIPLMAILGLLMGILGVILTKPLIILSTSVGGASAMGFALAGLFEEPTVGLLLGIILAIIGIFVQFNMDKKKPHAGELPMKKQGYQSGFPSFSWNEVKSLKKEDITSRQALYGAIIYGVLCFVVVRILGIVITMEFIVMPIGILWGIAKGGCANKAGIEYFVVNKDTIKSRKVIIGAILGITIGVIIVAVLRYRIRVTSENGIASSYVPPSIFDFFIFATVIGYIAEIREHYRDTYGNNFATSSSSATDRSVFQPSSKAVNPVSASTALVRDNTLLWTESLPIVVVETNIIPRPDNPSCVSLSLAFQNIGQQSVLAVYFGVKCFNLLKQELEPIDKLTIQDFVLEPGKSWTSAYPFELPDSDTRRIELTVQNVVFQDGDIWTNQSGAALLPVLKPVRLELSEELFSELELLGRERLNRRGLKKLWPYRPQQSRHYWGCGCGQMNLRDVCLNCGVDQATVFELTNPEYLAQKRDERLAEQQRLTNERAEDRARREAELRQRVSEQTQSAKENVSKLARKFKEVIEQGKNSLGKRQ